MNRWSFISGLTVTLFLLLLLSGFCIWTTRGLTDDLSATLSRNYENIRALHELRSALVRLNARTFVHRDPGLRPADPELLPPVRAAVGSRLSQLNRDGEGPLEREHAARLTAYCQSYFQAFDELAGPTPPTDARRVELSQVIAGLTDDIGSVVDQLSAANENAILARRDKAVLNGRRVTIIVTGFAVFSVAIYIFTSMRLTRGVFEPLRRLRDSIRLVSARRFDTVVPIEGGEEIGQIAASFNEMARELQQYISETDERVVATNRVCRAILESLPYPVFIVDRNFSVREANPRAAALSRTLGTAGLLPAEVRRQIDAAAAEDRDMVGDDIRRAVHLGNAAGGAAGGDYLPQIFRLAGALGAESAWAVLLVEVTSLRRKDEAKTKALTTLGHEVKTPIAGIRMSVHLLLEEKLGPLNPAQRELLEVGRDDCERLLVVLQALLELARLESGRTELHPAPTAPAELLTEVMAAHGDGVRRGGGELTVEAASDLPLVHADLLYASRVLGNFLVNAGKYGTTGRPVVLRAQPRDDGYVRLSVLNQGRPLSESEQAQMFEPFFRRPGDQADDSGLALAICREIALLHGGRVGVSCPAGVDEVEFYFDLRRAV